MIVVHNSANVAAKTLCKVRLSEVQVARAKELLCDGRVSEDADGFYLYVDNGNYWYDSVFLCFAEHDDAVRSLIDRDGLVTVLREKRDFLFGSEPSNDNQA